MEVAELVNAAGGLGRRKKMARWVSPTGLQALHAPLGAAVVRASPQISMIKVGEVTGRGARRKGDKAVSTTELVTIWEAYGQRTQLINVLLCKMFGFGRVGEKGHIWALLGLLVCCH